MAVLKLKMRLAFRYKWLLITILLFANCAHANSDHSLTNPQVLALIADYRASPVSQQGLITTRRILDFAESSEDVLVEINSKTTPWLTNQQISDALKALLLGAYVVGNIEPQLLSEIKEANHCGGANEVSKLLKLLLMPNVQAEVELVHLLNENSKKVFKCLPVVVNQPLEKA